MDSITTDIKVKKEDGGPNPSIYRGIAASRSRADMRCFGGSTECLFEQEDHSID